MIEAFFSLGFLAGLAGFAHCAGMCGGLVAALAMRHQGRRGLAFTLFYQAGRMATYTFLGWAGASLGAAILFAPWFARGARILLIASDLAVIALALGGLGLIPFLRLFPDDAEKLAGPLAWAAARAGRAPLPISGTALGMIFGFLPCGLLYPVLLAAAQTAEPVKGALTMAGFGLGTAPALIAVGGAAGRLRALSGKFMTLAWIAVLIMGSLNLYRHILAKAACCE